MRQCSICGRIPIGAVDTIEDATQVLTPRSQNAVEPETVLLGLDFAGVCRRNSIYFVGPDDAPLKVVHIAEELEAVDGED